VDDIWRLLDLTCEEVFAGIPKRHADLMIEMLEKIQSNLALLPPENATGNWVKVVQRVRVVRLQLTHVDAGFILQAGLSANVTVDTRPRDPALVEATRPTDTGLR
jgi:multidrug resistance efflux pump